MFLIIVKLNYICYNNKWKACENMIKKIGNVLLTLSLFILYLFYPILIFMLLQKSGLNIESLNKTTIAIIDVFICLSFMLILFFIFNKSLIKDFKEHIKHFKKNFSIGFKIWGIGLTIMLLSNIIIGLIYPVEAANEVNLQEMIRIMPLYMIFHTVIYAPFCEEIIFRKSIKNFINSDILYIFISGFSFGFVHILADLSDALQLLYIIPYGALGISFAYTYVKTKNIYTSITFHMLHNFIAISLSIILNIMAGGL